ncbi:MAG: DUF4115 domain-containing protein [Candidatus Accumulibacter sp.]|jgi:cytoskeleton protein RodZ|nr:DUF4115 domain-containing protein [Accumulibacter sp.]
MNDEDDFTGESFDAVIESGLFDREEETSPPFAFPSVGSELRTAREARDLTIGDVAKTLKLSVSQVEALEADDWRHLPGNTIIRGFVRNYARLLGLEPSALMSMLDASHVCEGCDLDVPADMNISVSSDKTLSLRDYLYVFMSVGVLLSSILVYFLLPDSVWQSALSSLRSLLPHEVKSSAPGAESRKTLSLSATVISDTVDPKTTGLKANALPVVSPGQAGKVGAPDTENRKPAAALSAKAVSTMSAPESIAPKTVVTKSETPPSLPSTTSVKDVPPSGRESRRNPVSSLPIDGESRKKNVSSAPIAPAVPNPVSLQELATLKAPLPESATPSAPLSPPVSTPPKETPEAAVPPPVELAGGEGKAEGGLPAPEREAPPNISGDGLIFNFLEGAWVEVRNRNDRVVFSQMNQEKTQHKIQIQPPFSLIVGNASNVRAYYNGKAIDLSSKRSAMNVARVVVQQ